MKREYRQPIEYELWQEEVRMAFLGRVLHLTIDRLKKTKLILIKQYTNKKSIHVSWYSRIALIVQESMIEDSFFI